MLSSTPSASARVAPGHADGVTAGLVVGFVLIGLVGAVMLYGVFTERKR